MAGPFRCSRIVQCSTTHSPEQPPGESITGAASGALISWSELSAACGAVSWCLPSPGFRQPVITRDGQPAICYLHQLEAWPDDLFLNKGNGTFDSAARRLGTFGLGSKGLGVVIVHFNGDDLRNIFFCTRRFGGSPARQTLTVHIRFSLRRLKVGVARVSLILELMKSFAYRWRLRKSLIRNSTNWNHSGICECWTSVIQVPAMFP